MVVLNIQGKDIKFVSYSLKSHTKTDDLTPLDKLDIDTSTKVTKWYFNGKYKSGTHYLQAICPKCNKNLFSTTTTRLISEIKKGDQNLTFVCRSCSCKENVKKINMNKRTRIRKENWKKKTDEERKEFGNAISKGRLKRANITEEKLQRAINAYVVDNEPLSKIRDILGVAGKSSAKKILQANGVKTRDFSEARSLYFKKYPKRNPFTRTDVIEKIKEYRKDHPIERNGKPSKQEIDFFNMLNEKNKQQHKRLKDRQFDVLVNDVYIEFDGIYWHGKTGGSYDFPQIHTMLNDEYKNNLIINEGKSLYRVWSDTKFNDYTLDEIREKAYYIVENGDVVKDEREFKETIITSSYVQIMIEKYPEKFDSNMKKLLLFVRAFYDFPWYEKNEDIDDVVKKIKKNNNTELRSSIRFGNDFLKSYFHSYFYSQKGKKMSMYDAFYNDNELMKIIKNRLGITYKEKWNLTLKVIRRGFYSNYYGVSFFNPVNAYNIYNKIAKPTDTILDMSCGFGGRLLGWYAFQKNGKYIGYEPNKITYRELVDFSKDMNVDLYNLPFEECKKHKVDVCFSCPPYFDTEIYSNDKTQSLYNRNTFNVWIKWLKECVEKMLDMSDKVYLVVNDKIKNSLNCQVIDIIKNKGSHFTKKENYEYLIKCK